MKLDFTVEVYEELLINLKNSGYNLIRFEEFLLNKIKHDKYVILRHDVDKKPGNSYLTAKLENALNIRSTYYFRIVKDSNDPDIIEKIRDLGHEIGYHYEDLALCKGNFEGAFYSFSKNLNYLKTFYHVKTICMHGSPTSKWDNRLLWKKYSYKDLKIIGEPYFDVDFNEVLYLTDTGRCWNGDKVNIRDKVKKNFSDLNIKSTFDLIKFIKENKLPNKIMITVHPQRWNQNIFFWIIELLGQKIKNLVKRIIVYFNAD